MRPVDVDHVQRDGHPGGSTGLGHELIGNEMWGHLVQNARDLERQWSISSQLARGLKRQARDLPNTLSWLGSRRFLSARGRLDFFQSLVEGLPIGKVPINRRAAYPGCGGDLGHTEAPVAGKRRRRGEDPLAASDRVGAHESSSAGSAAARLGLLRGLRHR